MNEIIYLNIFYLTSIAVVALVTYKSWLPYIRPDWFYIFNIYENGMNNFKEEKIFIPIRGRAESYEIDKSEYDKTDYRPYHNSQGVYCWNFIKGQAKPIEFVVARENIEGTLLFQAKKQAMDYIWFNGNNFGDFMQKYGIWIIGGIMVVLFFYMIGQNNKTIAIMQNFTMALR